MTALRLKPGDSLPDLIRQPGKCTARQREHPLGS